MLLLRDLGLGQGHRRAESRRSPQRDQTVGKASWRDLIAPAHKHVSGNCATSVQR